MGEEQTRSWGEVKWGEVKDVLLTNSTLILTLLYLYVTAVGMLYSAWLYGRFGINIFDYSEIADFLLAGFKNWIAVVSAALLTAMGVNIAVYTTIRVSNRTQELRIRAVDLEATMRSLARAGHWEEPQHDTDKKGVRQEYENDPRKMAKARLRETEQQNLDAQKDRLLEIDVAALGERLLEIDEKFNETFKNTLRELQGNMVKAQEDLRKRLRERMVLLITLVPISIFLSFVILPYYSASRTASDIKQGERPTIDVHYRSFKGSAGQVTVSGLQFIGATQKAAFFYDEDDKRTIVIPQAQLVSMDIPEHD